MIKNRRWNKVGEQDSKFQRMKGNDKINLSEMRACKSKARIISSETRSMKGERKK